MGLSDLNCYGGGKNGFADDILHFMATPKEEEQ
jgi:hypothetical protein